MNDRFIAIKVGQGDAFFIQRDERTALIDGGRAKKGFPNLYRNEIGTNHADIVVCTHNDADHAKGIVGFLECNLMSCGEVWLPASWENRLDDLVNRPDNFEEELQENLSDFQFSQEMGWNKGLRNLQDIGNVYSDEQLEQNSDSQEVGNSVSSIKRGLSFDNKSRKERITLKWRGLATNQIKKQRIYNYRPTFMRVVLHQAIAAAKNIREIAVTCSKKGYPVRWFRYDKNRACGGERDFLVPLNAMEIQWQPNISNKMPALKYLALSVVNKESLTFFSPRSDSFPGVIFTADSDLVFSQKIPWCKGMIVTTPHHGSKDNYKAYIRIQREMSIPPDVIMVRSDGKYRSRPGKYYLKHPQCKRFCTNCFKAIFSKQSVSFCNTSGSWVPQSGVIGCSCP